MGNSRTGVIVALVAIFIYHSYGANSIPERESCRRNQSPCNSGMCIDVFLLCDGTVHCDDGSDETADFCSRRRCPSQAFQCDYGACIDKEWLCDGVIQCADGSDEIPERCKTRPFATLPSSNNNTAPSSVAASIDVPPRIDDRPTLMCPSLSNPSLEVMCLFDNKEVDCDYPVPPGTSARVNCNTYYVNGEFSRLNITCQVDGKWSRQVLPCYPKCGDPNPDGVPFISGGVVAKTGEFPWHAGLYKNTDGSYHQICGGNIVSERVIVTAGHCIWNDATSKLVDTKLFKVAVGKYYRDWNAKERYIQTPEIDKFIIHNRFRGSIRNWANDIALIILKDAIKMTLAVRPICVDFDKNYDKMFIPGNNGVVVGWGVTETMRPSDILYTTTLPYVSFENCEKEVPSFFLSYLSNDKFCAGYLNGTSVCPGDGGGGFASQFKGGKWYLMGLASVGVPGRHANACNVNQFATFTRVSDYYSFVESHISK